MFTFNDPTKLFVATLRPTDIPPGTSRTALDFKAPLADCTASLSVYRYADGAELAVTPPS